MLLSLRTQTARSIISAMIADAPSIMPAVSTPSAIACSVGVCPDIFIVAHACNGIIITMAMINIAAMVPVRVLCL